MGKGSMGASTTGSNNTSIGYFAMFTNTTASNNTAVGYAALYDNTTGAGNTCVGESAGNNQTTADYNVCIGKNANENGTTGHSNTAVGTNAGRNISTGDNNLLLGYEAGITGSPGGNINNENNHICLGDENITEAHIQVDWTVASDERDKTDFTDLDIGLDFVKQLAPVTYKWDKRSNYIDKNDPDADLDKVEHDGTHKEDWLDIGFKAQEVEKIEASAGYKIADKTNLTTTVTTDGKQYGIQYNKFVPILVKAIQELSAEVEELKSKLNEE
jgi:hypothetical protein